MLILHYRCSCQSAALNGAALLLYYSFLQVHGEANAVSHYILSLCFCVNLYIGQIHLCEFWLSSRSLRESYLLQPFCRYSYPYSSFEKPIYRKDKWNNESYVTVSHLHGALLIVQNISTENFTSSKNPKVLTKPTFSSTCHASKLPKIHSIFEIPLRKNALFTKGGAASLNNWLVK